MPANDLTRARTLLGVASHASEIEVRRAYLKKIRTVKPETDPEGFKQVREAYELARKFAGSEPAPVEDADEIDDGLYDSDDDSHDFHPRREPGDPPLFTLPPRSEPDYGVALASALELAIESHRFDDIPAAVVIEYGLEALAEGQREPATSLLQRWFSAAAEHHVRLTDVPLDQLVIVAARELAFLPDDTPMAFVQAMADGISTNEIDRACAELTQITRAHVEDAARLANHIHSRPILARLFGKHLRVRGPIEQLSDWFEDNRWSSWVLMIAVILLMRALRGCD